MPVVVPEQRLSRAARVPFGTRSGAETAASIAEGPRHEDPERVRCEDRSSEGITAGMATHCRVISSRSKAFRRRNTGYFDLWD